MRQIVANSEDNVQSFFAHFWGLARQVLLCLKSGHHGRHSRTHGPDLFLITKNSVRS